MQKIRDSWIDRHRPKTQHLHPPNALGCIDAWNGKVTTESTYSFEFGTHEHRDGSRFHVTSRACSQNVHRRRMKRFPIVRRPRHVQIRSLRRKKLTLRSVASWTTVEYWFQRSSTQHFLITVLGWDQGRRSSNRTRKDSWTSGPEGDFDSMESESFRRGEKSFFFRSSTRAFARRGPLEIFVAPDARPPSHL